MKTMTTQRSFLLAVLIGFSISACESFRVAWLPENRSATIARLQKDGMTLLGRVAFNTLANLGSNNGDYGHSAAQAVWQSVRTGDIATVIRHAGGERDLAQTAETFTRQLVARGVPVKDATNAVASAISVGALTGKRHD